MILFILIPSHKTPVHQNLMALEIKSTGEVDQVKFLAFGHQLVTIYVQLAKEIVLLVLDHYYLHSSADSKSDSIVIELTNQVQESCADFFLVSLFVFLYCSFFDVVAIYLAIIQLPVVQHSITWHGTVKFKVRTVYYFLWQQSYILKFSVFLVKMWQVIYSKKQFVTFQIYEDFVLKVICLQAKCFEAINFVLFFQITSVEVIVTQAFHSYEVMV